MLIIRIFISIILLYSLNVCAEYKSNIEHQKYLAAESKIKGLLFAKKAFSFAKQDSDIQLSIENSKLKFLEDNINEIENLSLVKLDKKNNIFKILIELKSTKDNNAIIINGKFSEFLSIPSLKTRISSGYKITAQDIEYLSIDTKNYNSNYVIDESELLGKTLKHSVPAHTPIKKNNLMMPIVINKKDLVNVIYQKDNVTLQMLAVAIDSAAPGDTIRVKNTKSNAILHGIVDNNKTVKLN